jgi:hypothetical protein
VTLDPWPQRPDDTPLIDLAARRTRGTGRLARLFSRADQATTSAVIALTTDRPHDDATAMRDAVRGGSGSALKPGKGVNDATTAYDDIVGNVVPMVRPRVMTCARCQGRATLLYPATAPGAAPVRMCDDCSPRGVFGVVPGPEDVA